MLTMANILRANCVWHIKAKMLKVTGYAKDSTDWLNNRFKYVDQKSRNKGFTKKNTIKKLDVKNLIKQTCQTTTYFLYFLQTLSLCSQSWGYGKMGKPTPTQTHTHSLLRWKTWQLFATGVHVGVCVCVFSYTWILFWSRVEAVYTHTHTYASR